MTKFIAALPMYDWPERRAEVGAQWAVIRDALREKGVDAPQGLTRRNGDLPAVPGGIRDAAGVVIAPDPSTLPPDELDHATLWRHPNLLFAQTCWGPMETTGLASHVAVVGQPGYSDVEGGAGDMYSSAIVMRCDLSRTSSVAPPSGLPAISPTRGEITRGDGASVTTLNADRGDWLISPRVGEMAGRPEGGDVERDPAANLRSPANGVASLPLDLLRGARLAYNEPHSMSGILALTRDLEAAGESLAIFAQRIETGGHRLSIRAVAEGLADVCAIDCRSWALAKAHEPAAQAVHVVGWTARRKGLPFVASRRLPDNVIAILRRVFAG